MSGVKTGVCGSGVKGPEQVERAAGVAHMLSGDRRSLAANLAARKAQPTVVQGPPCEKGLENDGRDELKKSG